MTRTTKFTTWGLMATLAATAAAPVLADGQSDKNNMRNLAIAGAAIAGYGLLNHNSAATLLGAAGAALAGSQYEKDRKQQSQDNNWRYDRSYDRQNDRQNNGQNDRRYHRTENSNNSQWRNDYNPNASYRANTGQWTNGQTNGQWTKTQNTNNWNRDTQNRR